MRVSLLALLALSFSALAVPPALASDWREVDQLAGEMKLQAALDQAKKILARAEAGKNEALLTQALIKVTQLETGLHGYETSVRFLKGAAWPKGGAMRALLQLYYAQALVAYQQVYGYEIARREETASSTDADLRSWTTARLGREIGLAFDAAMAEGPALNEPVPAFYQPYLRANNYPAGIRPTLRDLLVYMAVEHLANRQFWSPEESNESYKQSFPGLAALGSAKRLSAADQAAHPLARIESWLGEHLRFHESHGRAEAQLEARYKALSIFHENAPEDDDKAAIVAALRALQAGLEKAKTPWWSRGQALLAEMLQARGQPGRMIEARQEALRGRDAFPQSPGGQSCAAIVAEIERPELRMEAMAADAAAKRSVLLTYRNLRKAYLRAYPVDADRLLREQHGSPLQGVDVATIQKLLRERSTPSAAWSIDLPETRDFGQHRAFVTTPALAPGVYVIVASAREGFGEANNILVAAQSVVSDLVITTQNAIEGGVELRALSGSTGKPIEGAELSLFRVDWQRAPVPSGTARSGPDGYARFARPPAGQEHGGFFVLGRWNGHTAFEAQGIYFGRESEERIHHAALLFTDRSVYRPGQKVQFKVMGYRGKHSTGRFEAAKQGEAIRVELLDPNFQVVAHKQVSLGSFGTGSGELVVPEGKLLGGWRLRASGRYQGQAALRVEEYKRPTFEASFREAAEALRLNRKARLVGEAKYYFGAPLTGGRVRWRVTRAEVLPWWPWDGLRPGARLGTGRIVASGASALQADGTFTLEFLPEADERGAGGKDLSYSFRVEADVTDEGGETRSASRVFRLGLVAAEARLEWDSGFFPAGEEVRLRALLSNLDGKPLAGQATYKLSRIDTPSTLLPAELPYEGEEGYSPRPRRSKGGGAVAGPGADALGEYALPDDSRRARWHTSFRWEAVTREWKEAELVAEGKLTHDAKGEAALALKPLKAGVYRLAYRTVDAFGAPYETFRDFLVGGARPGIKLPLVLALDNPAPKPGEKARLLAHSGLEGQLLALEIYRGGKRVSRRDLVAGKDGALIELPVAAADRGGFTVVVSGVRDHQQLRAETHVQVPWADRELKLEFSTFRDKLRPATKETFRVAVKDHTGKPLGKGAAEILAYMYDRSLDLFGEHAYPSVKSLYPSRIGAHPFQISLGTAAVAGLAHSIPHGHARFHLHGDELEHLSNYGVGGPGHRGGFGYHDQPMAMMEAASVAPGRAQSKSRSSLADQASDSLAGSAAPGGAPPAPAPPPVAEPVRANFAETAFFAPHLVTGAGGAAAIEFSTPDSVTSWRVLAHALTTDLRGGTVSRETRTAKELMVRPYAPRFLREGDEAEIQVQVNNASEAELSGELVFEIEDNLTGKSALADFSLRGEAKRAFTVPKGGSVTLGFPIKAPRKVGDYSFKAVARTKTFSDGERRPFPLLPSRLHLAQSRFAALKGKDKRVLEFKDMAGEGDPSLQHEKLVVTVDAQLFYGVLQALPYLVNYPYECVEQTLNRFLSTGIVTSLFGKYPSVAKMAKELSSRKTVLESFGGADPNRRMAMEETPWLRESEGGGEAGEGVLNLLSPEAAKEAREVAVAKLRKMQLSSGAFPWFQGGPADEHMTLYVLLGLSRALEFGAEAPKDVAVKGWGFVKSWLDEHLAKFLANDAGWEAVTLVNFALSSYPDGSWTGDLFDKAYREKLLAFSFKHWKEHSPLLKGYLALTLQRLGRSSDARLVWEAVMDSVKLDDQLGAYWAREERSWLWYNDQIETHAFALRVQMELAAKDARNEGLVQWLFLNKKLNHWKSTRATAEVIYSLAHYLGKAGQLGQREAVRVDLGTQRTELEFEPDRYTGRKNQIVLPGEKIEPKRNSRVEVSKSTPGIAFASATWHFATEKLPLEASGDFFSVSRRFFRREQVPGKGWQLVPLAEGAAVRVGDQIEVQLSLKAKHEAEYVHLRDPRGAGFEPESQVSGYKWDLGIFWYEEIRDSGANFFFSRLPVGEYTFRYRLRANMAGAFRVGPATVQSMYAPEFGAYSSGEALRVEPAK